MDRFREEMELKEKQLERKKFKNAHKWQNHLQKLKEDQQI